MTLSARDLALALGQPEPTAQQCAVIEAPLAPALVVAGAGSGKTETMANRVVWLLANALVTPGEVLGLTFTRKAAGELADRIRARIRQLRSKGLLHDASADGADLFEQPAVSTYNAFANALFRDNALLVGRESESVLLSDAAAWGLARRIVIAHGDDRLVAFDKGIDRVTEAVLRLSGQLSENVADPAEAARFAEEFCHIADAPYSCGRAKKTPYKSVTDAVGVVSALPPLLELAVRFADEKRRRALVEFSDQVALALQVCRGAPHVAQEYRQRYRVVLLDEYQDTSVVQTRLLKELFAGHAVMAVGDPQQSIYGWRGASAANLGRFADDFGGSGDAADGTVPVFDLSVSWRNARSILSAANTIIAPLRPAGSLPLEPRPSAPAGMIAAHYVETVDQEAESVADWLAAQLERPTGTGGRRSAAVLFRARRHMELFAGALRRRGIRCHVLGLGGLLSTPEIVDLVSALRVVNDPAAGSALIRLLSGARWRIGVRDLKELRRVAAWLQQRDWAQAPLTDEVKQRIRESVSTDDGASIVDALDFVAQASPRHSVLAAFSEEALPRLREAGRLFAFFRSRRGAGLPDLVRLVEQELRLDIEVVANERTGRIATAQANLYAFQDEVAGFLAADPQAGLGEFLGWLDRAGKQDTMEPRSEPEEPGAVQLLTIHGAKGLEWDIVAVPRLVEEELPAKPREGAGWLAFGELPFALRGDANELPVLNWRGIATQADFDAELKDFKAGLAVRQRNEERRLGYVALTRAREDLLLTGSFWAGTIAKPRPPSIFLTELAEAGCLAALPSGSDHESNPRADDEHPLGWPLDPLGARRAAVEGAAAAVRAAARTPEVQPPEGQTRKGLWSDDIDALLAERARRAAENGAAPLPTRIPASRFKDFVTDPDAVAAQLRRPMPQKPYRQTRLGTLFHSWVEARSGVHGHGDLIDAAGHESDLSLDQHETVAGPAELAALQATFEAGPWALRRPEEAEVEIHFTLADRIVVCKLDAVYPSEDSRFDYQIVDWKTGKAPKDAEDLRQKQLQLALYRLAFAAWRGVPPERVDAVFYFVAEDEVVRPQRLYSEEELVELWSSATGGRPGE